MSKDYCYRKLKLKKSIKEMKNEKASECDDILEELRKTIEGEGRTIVV